jgi:tRNA pseudouridine(38-40) synthase
MLHGWSGTLHQPQSGAACLSASLDLACTVLGCLSYCTARFSCASREYKYFIVQDGSLDVAAMRAAAQHLLGEHDFRHFCKADVLQVWLHIV